MNAVKLSIRKFLLVNLLLTITITTTLTAIGNYYLDQKDIQEHLDTLMTISALSYQALMGDDIHQRHLENIQNALNNIPKKIDYFYHNRYLNDLPPTTYNNRFNFQVWNQQGDLLLHSANNARTPFFKAQEGFSDHTYANDNWRVYATTNDKNKIKITLAERYDTRNELGHRIAQDDLYIMLLTFPLSGLLIWIIISRGLDGFSRVASEVANRAPSNLEPVNIEAVPEEIKPLIDELNKLFFRLHEGFEREKRFAADAAHELRTPLAAIKAQAQVALNIADMNEKNRALEKLIASVNRSAHIVQQLLTMSKLLPETSTPHDANIMDLVKTTREVLTMLTPSALERNIDIEFEHEKNSLEMLGNATAISILVRNLVDNAIRYTYENGQIQVRVYIKEKDKIALEVQDNGPGVPESLRSRVFERFYRVLGNKSPGSGLGLAIVKQIVDLYGGTIELDTPEEHTGLIVRCIFPLLISYKKNQ